MLWNEYPTLSLALAVVVGIAVMYIVRTRAHRAIDSLGRAGHRQLRLMARGCTALAALLNVRNREVMLALQTEITRRQLEWDFQRVAAAVEQDMTKFQQLERAINEHITLLGEDFERSTQVPPAAPGWIGAVDAIAKLQLDTHPEPVGRILQDIHNSVQDQQREVMREYRWAVNARHKILADMSPLWRTLSRQVATVGKDSRDLLARIHRVDTQMAAFRELCANRAEVRVESLLARWLVALAGAAGAEGLGAGGGGADGADAAGGADRVAECPGRHHGDAGGQRLYAGSDRHGSACQRMPAYHAPAAAARRFAAAQPSVAVDT